jgi:hypothetical protein
MSGLLFREILHASHSEEFGAFCDLLRSAFSGFIHFLHFPIGRLQAFLYSGEHRAMQAESDSMAGTMDALRLRILRFGEWLEGLSPLGRAALEITLLASLIVAAYFGLLPSKHVHYNPHAVFNW